MRMVVAVTKSAMGVIGWNHAKMLYYNITSAKPFKSQKHSNGYGVPITWRWRRPGTETRPDRSLQPAEPSNQTNRAGMNGILEPQP